jgi:4-hydroxybenzoate polyprenyltransferase/phosphoserine phosphatase
MESADDDVPGRGAKSAPAAGPAAPPLVVDLDGTLILSDLLDESFLATLSARPLSALAALAPLLRGDRAALKRRLAGGSGLDPALVPLRADLVAHLRAEKEKGRRLVLATASDELLARPLAAPLGLFDEVLASDGARNLGGEAKRGLLVSRYGEKGFDYAGDRRADLPVFRSARNAILAGGGVRLRAEVEAAGTPVAAAFPGPDSGLRDLLGAIRVRQWVKNLLVFVPLVTGHVFGAAALLAAVVAFLALSACASGLYVLNDLVDLAADRRHPAKRSRPFASGALPVRLGLLLVPLLLAAAVALGALLPPGARLLLAGYAATSALYSFFLKRKVLLDVFTLAFLYTLRVLLGGAATLVPVSPWLLAFSVFIFLSLAFAKRASELFSVRERGHEGASGRDWFVRDSAAVHALGVTSAYGAGMVLAIYVHSDHVRGLYAHPGWLWLLVPLLLYWASRVWILVGRGEMDEDPIVFALRDRVTWAIGLLTAAVLLAAARAPFGIPGLME